MTIVATWNCDYNMSYRIPGPEASSRGRGRSRGFPPQYRRRPPALRSAQGIYPICADNDAAVSFVEFIHTQGTQTLHAASGPWAPELYASLIGSARDHISSTGSRKGVFRPDSQSNQYSSAKHYFPGFSIRFLSEHSFLDSTGGTQSMPPGDYQG